MRVSKDVAERIMRLNRTYDDPGWVTYVDIEYSECYMKTYFGTFAALLPWNRPPIPKNRKKKYDQVRKR